MTLPTTLTGIAASPGICSGQAFVVDRPEAVTGSEVGILILRTAGVDWLEVIVRSKAVVTEFGGKTSHAASICRELGKPCVTAVPGITSIVRSGTHMIVDGDLGTVTIFLSQT